MRPVLSWSSAESGAEAVYAAPLAFSQAEPAPGAAKRFAERASLLLDWPSSPDDGEHLRRR